jgi:protein-S-isoprenylcysteine O-methyltransferase Ste14
MLAIQRSTIDLTQVQHVRKAVLLATIFAGAMVVTFGDSAWPGGKLVHETIEWAGIGLIAFCILGRTWCAIYIGGRKVHSLVTVGPYSVSRNPLYLFSTIGAIGAGAQLGSVTLGLIAGLVALLVFYLVTLKEEQVLVAKFGNEYRHYLAKVSRFVPHFSLWRDVERIEVRPSIVLRTFMDATIFLLSIPLAEGFEYLHEIGAVPAFFHLP